MESHGYLQHIHKIDKEPEPRIHKISWKAIRNARHLNMKTGKDLNRPSQKKKSKFPVIMQKDTIISHPEITN